MDRGRNVQIDYRFVGINPELINKNVTELVHLTPDVIVAHTTRVMAALKPTTSTVPIVFVMLNDPVNQGFISSLAHPGGNITGFSFLESDIVGKWTNLLGDVRPNLSRVALMFKRLPGLKFMRTLWVCNISGGPFQFTTTRPGTTPLGLEEAHRHLRISPAEFDEVAAELGRTLDYFKVPKPEKGEVLAAFVAHKDEVTAGYVAAAKRG
jgi:hypothetical protein